MNLLPLSFIAKSRERLLTDGPRIEKLLAGSESHLMSIAAVGHERTAAETDSLLDERQFLFVDELLAQARNSWLYGYFIADSRFVAMRKISAGEPLSARYLAVDGRFASSARAALGPSARTSSGSEEHDGPISAYRKAPYLLHGLFSFKASLASASCKDPVFLGILAKEIDSVNIKLLLGSALSGAAMPEPLGAGSLSPSFFRSLSGRPEGEILQKLAQSGWGSLLQGQTQAPDWAAAEKRIDETLYEHSRRSLYSLLGPAPVYSYILAKKMETRNFRMALAVKKLGLPEASVAPYLYRFVKN